MRASVLAAALCIACVGPRDSGAPGPQTDVPLDGTLRSMGLRHADLAIVAAAIAERVARALPAGAEAPVVVVERDQSSLPYASWTSVWSTLLGELVASGRAHGVRFGLPPATSDHTLRLDMRDTGPVDDLDLVVRYRLFRSTGGSREELASASEPLPLRPEGLR